FWLGEAPGRSDELSLAVSRLREEVSKRLVYPGAQTKGEDSKGLSPDEDGAEGWLRRQHISNSRRAASGNDSRASLPLSAFDWLRDEVGVNESAARQIVEYLGGAKAAFGMLPTQQVLAMERFFDESGGMQLVIHTPNGSRLNRAWGLALRKRFCRSFNFELQAAATEDAIILSLSTSHSFPLDDVTRYLHSNSAR